MPAALALALTVDALSMRVAVAIRAAKQIILTVAATEPRLADARLRHIDARSTSSLRPMPVSRSTFFPVRPPEPFEEGAHVSRDRDGRNARPRRSTFENASQRSRTWGAGGEGRGQRFSIARCRGLILKKVHDRLAAKSATVADVASAASGRRYVAELTGPSCVARAACSAARTVR